MCKHYEFLSTRYMRADGTFIRMPLCEVPEHRVQPSTIEILLDYAPVDACSDCLRMLEEQHAARCA